MSEEYALETHEKKNKMRGEKWVQVELIIFPDAYQVQGRSLYDCLGVHVWIFMFKIFHSKK